MTDFEELKVSNWNIWGKI